MRICLPMRGTRVRALVWEDPTCRGATRPVSHVEPARLEPVLRNKRGHNNERPAHHNEEWPPLAATRYYWGSNHGEEFRHEEKIRNTPIITKSH